MREQSPMLHSKRSQDKKVECCKGEAGNGISKWSPDHKEPCIFAFLTGACGLRAQHGSSKDKLHQLYLILFLSRL